MKIYLISNRRVVGNTFQNKGTERVQSTFRIASCTLDNDKKTAVPSILPDKFEPDYEDVVRAIQRKNTSSLRGTARLFCSLNRYSPSRMTIRC